MAEAEDPSPRASGIRFSHQSANAGSRPLKGDPLRAWREAVEVFTEAAQAAYDDASAYYDEHFGMTEVLFAEAKVKVRRV